MNTLGRRINLLINLRGVVYTEGDSYENWVELLERKSKEYDTYLYRC